MQERITIVKGNDFDLSVTVSRLNEETQTYEPYNLEGCTDVCLSLVGMPHHIQASGVTTEGNTIKGEILGRCLRLGAYGVQVSFVDGGMQRRSYECGLIEFVNVNIHDGNQTEIEGNDSEDGVSVNLYTRVQCDNILIGVSDKDIEASAEAEPYDDSEWSNL